MENGSGYFPPIEVEDATFGLQTTISLLDELASDPGAETEASALAVRTATQRYLWKLPILKHSALLLVAANRIKQKQKDGDFLPVPELNSMAARQVYMSRVRTTPMPAVLNAYSHSVGRLGHILARWNVALEASQTEMASDQYDALVQSILTPLQGWATPRTEIVASEDGILGVAIIEDDDRHPLRDMTLTDAGFAYEDLVHMSRRIDMEHKKLRHILSSMARLMVNDLTYLTHRSTIFVAKVAELAISLVNRDMKIYSILTSDLSMGAEMSQEALGKSESPAQMVDDLKTIMSEASKQHKRISAAMKAAGEQPAFVSMSQQHKLRNVLKVATTGLGEIYRRYLGASKVTDDHFDRLQRLSVSLVDGLKDRAHSAEDPGFVRHTGSNKAKVKVVSKFDHLLDLYFSVLEKMEDRIRKKAEDDTLGAKEKQLLSKSVSVIHQVTSEVFRVGELTVEKLNTHKEG